MIKKLKIIIFIITWFYTFSSHAVSTEPKPDGVARIVLKNQQPCIYLNNGKMISRIVISGSHTMSLQEKGNTEDTCVVVDGMEYNRPYQIFVSHLGGNQNMAKAHIFLVCLEKKETVRLALVENDDHGMHCSTQNWRPTKHYVRVNERSARLELKDWFLSFLGSLKTHF